MTVSPAARPSPSTPRTSSTLQQHIRAYTINDAQPPTHNLGRPNEPRRTINTSPNHAAHPRPGPPTAVQVRTNPSKIEQIRTSRTPDPSKTGQKPVKIDPNWHNSLSIGLRTARSRCGGSWNAPGPYQTLGTIRQGTRSWYSAHFSGPYFSAQARSSSYWRQVNIVTTNSM